MTRGPQVNTQLGDSLVLLANAIDCFLLLADVERQLAPRTVSQYRLALSRLQAHAEQFGRERLDQFTPNLVRSAAAAEMEDGRADNWKGGEATAASIVVAARTMVRRLHEEYPALPLPDLSTVHLPKVPKRIQPRLQDGEFAALEAALRLRLLRDRVPRFLIARDMAILEVLGNTGFRANECSSLNVEDVDLNEGAITVHKGKGDKWRILTIVDPDEPRDGGEVIRALVDYMRYRERLFGLTRSHALWLTLRGNRLMPDALRNTLRGLCDEAGIDGNRPPHAFRRAYFTEQYRAQPTALPVLVERMGWEGDAMARVYTRGVDIELARRVPLPLQSKKWRESTVKLKQNRPIVQSGAGPGRGKADAPPGPPLQRNPERRASVSPRKGQRQAW